MARSPPANSPGARSFARWRRTRTRASTRMVGGRDVIPLIGRVGVIESVNGSKAFAQLYAALALRHFGADLSKNALWQSLSADDRLKWKALLDPTRFYNPKTRQVIDLPENYLGVASRVATLSFQMGVITDRAFVDALLDRAAEPFTKGALYADDAGTAGRYDRYSNEYARYVYEAAETVNRQDILNALKPSLRAQSQLWWDLVSLDGYGYNWGRSLGVVSYLDTLEIVAFLCRPSRSSSGAARRSHQRVSAGVDLAARQLRSESPHAAGLRAGPRQLRLHHEGTRVAAERRVLRQGADGPGYVDARARGREGHRRSPRNRICRPWRDSSSSAAAIVPPACGWCARVRCASRCRSRAGPGRASPIICRRRMAFPDSRLPWNRPFRPARRTSRWRTAGCWPRTDGADEIMPGADGRSLQATWRRFALVGGKTGNLIEPGFTVSITWTNRRRDTDAHRNTDRDAQTSRSGACLAAVVDGDHVIRIRGRRRFACPARTVCSRRATSGNLQMRSAIRTRW